MFQLNNKVAVITGGSSGIGEAISRLFAENGAYVFILDVNDSLGEQVCDQVNSSGGKCGYLHCDVSQQEEVKIAFEKAEKEGGKLDILINNAGVAHVGNAESTGEEDFDRIYHVNVKGAYNCIHAAIPKLRNSGGGSVVNMASVASVVAVSERFAYMTSKGAVWAMTLSVAKDYVTENIRCNAIAPARVHTPFVDGYLRENYPGEEKEMFEKLSKTQPIGRMAKPEEIAAMALYLCSDEASFITGSLFPVDGGFITLNS